MLSEHNQFDFRLTPPPRGLILDRNGVVLATNRPDFRLFVSRDNDTDAEALVDRVAKLVPIDDAHRARLIEDINDAPRKAPVTVMEDLTWEEFSRINVRTPELPGVTADSGDIRVYPYSGAFAHVIGYVAKVSKEDVTKTGPNSDPILLNPGFRIGKAGLEKTYDLPMRGKPGAKKVEVDVKGRVVREDAAGDVPSTPGAALQLTLDADIQNRAMEVFGEESGAAVMMDCRSGDILCLASAPSFDANRFVKGLTGPEYQALAEYERKPLFNKALTATYPPGSTFKTMVSLTALEMGIPPTTTYTCEKVWFWGGRPWHCDEAHGTLDMKGAIAKSCDIYFYQLALKIGGPDPIAATARKFGLGQTFDIGVPGQKPGLIPTTAYKRRAFPHDPVWHPGETPSLGIGQGYVNVNALQLCVMCSRIANGDRALQPRLVRSIGGVLQPSGAEAPELPFRQGACGVHTQRHGRGGDQRHRRRRGQSRPRTNHDGRQDRHRPVTWLCGRYRRPRGARRLEPARPCLVHRLRTGRRPALRHVGLDGTRRVRAPAPRRPRPARLCAWPCSRIPRCARASNNRCRRRARRPML